LAGGPGTGPAPFGWTAGDTFSARAYETISVVNG